MSTTKKSPPEEGNFTTCPCTGVTLDKLVQPGILAILAEGPAHGYRLAERLGGMPSFAGQKPDPSGVYRLLKGMEKRDLVVYSWDPSQTGPAKRTYQITARGRQCLHSWVCTLEEYRGRITALLKTTRDAVNKYG